MRSGSFASVASFGSRKKRGRQLGKAHGGLLRRCAGEAMALSTQFHKFGNVFFRARAQPAKQGGARTRTRNRVTGLNAFFADYEYEHAHDTLANL